MNTVTRILVAAAVPAVLAVPTLVLAQTSELYLTDVETTKVYVVQGGKLVHQFDRSAPTDGPGLAIVGTIMMIGRDDGRVGREYAIDGTPLSGRYPNPGFRDVYDGATNGDKTWSVAHNHFPNFPVVVGDAEWGNLRQAFVPQRRSSGITYDAINDSLWVTNNVGGTDRIQQYSLDGQLISEFAAAIQGGYGIAWDPADDTLWIPGSWGTSDLFQYDKSGKRLQRLPVEGLSQRILGAEFQYAGVRCGDKAKLKAICKKGGAKVKAKLKKSRPNIPVVFFVDMERRTPGQTNKKGKAKASWKGLDPGGHEVSVCELQKRCG